MGYFGLGLFTLIEKNKATICEMRVSRKGCPDQTAYINLMPFNAESLESFVLPIFEGLDALPTCFKIRVSAELACALFLKGCITTDTKMVPKPKNVLFRQVKFPNGRKLNVEVWPHFYSIEIEFVARNGRVLKSPLKEARLGVEEEIANLAKVESGSAFFANAFLDGLESQNVCLAISALENLLSKDGTSGLITSALDRAYKEGLLYPSLMEYMVMTRLATPIRHSDFARLFKFTSSVLSGTHCGFGPTDWGRQGLDRNLDPYDDYFAL